MDGWIGFLRKLAAATHLALGLALLIGAGTFLRSLWRAHAHWGDVLVLGPAFAIILLLAGWFGVLGWQTWRMSPGWRARLRHTSLAVLIVGVCLVWAGYEEIRAAARSAAHGGGLLGGLGEIVVSFGVALGLIGGGSLLAAWREKPGGSAAPVRPD